MKSKILAAGVIALLALFVVAFTGSMTAEDVGSKKCPMSGEKMEGKACSKEMCVKMKQHKEAMGGAIREMGEHLAYIQDAQDDREWMEAVGEHMVMLQGVLDEMANCPMEGMMHRMMHQGVEEAGSESK